MSSKCCILYYILGLILALCVFPVNSADVCTYSYSSKRYCDYGCCGNIYSTYDGVCCSYNLAGIIAGSVIAGLVVIGVTIAIIIFCCAGKSGNRRGNVVAVQPTSTVQTNTLYLNTYSSGPPPYPGYYGPSYVQPAGIPQPPPYAPSAPPYPPYPPPPPKH